jgi:uncharacterized protein (TIGR04255 family)
MPSGEFTLNATLVGPFPQLSRPPLREALIDIRLAENLPPSFVDQLKIPILAGYLRVGDIKYGGMRFQLPPDRPAQVAITSDEIVGARFDKEDKSKAVQFRRDGITFSVLKDYRNWDDIRCTAGDFWQLFLDLAGTQVAPAIKRLAVRYINVINVPATGDLDHYLTAGPRIPSALPQGLTTFLQRLVVPFTEEQASAIITQALEPQVESVVPTVLDIDVFSEVGSIDGANAEVWNRLDRLRFIKNRVFFAFLTPKSLDMYR